MIMYIHISYHVDYNPSGNLFIYIIIPVYINIIAASCCWTEHVMLGCRLSYLALELARATVPAV